MQHLDEGTIHSWLDGALSTDDAARAEAHVKECPQCAAAAAEARGFIAASSRILTALDNAPRGVVPAAAPIKRRNLSMWRAAAAVLVVAAGSLVVLRNGEDKARTASAVLDTARLSATAVGATQATQPLAKAVETPKAAAPTPIVKKSPAIASRSWYSGTAESSILQRSDSVRKQRLQGAVAGVVVNEDRAASQTAVAAAPAPAAQMPAPIRLRGAMRGAAMMDMESELAPLKVVGTSNTIAARVTLYEVAPGDTVTLTESVSFQLNAVVRGVAPQALPLQVAGKSAAAAPTRRADAAAVSAPDSQRTAAGAVGAPSERASVAEVEVANGVITIGWVDTTTGNVLKLSGRMPVVRLQEIRLRIERERAAAAATKKNP